MILAQRFGILAHLLPPLVLPFSGLPSSLTISSVPPQPTFFNRRTAHRRPSRVSVHNIHSPYTSLLPRTRLIFLSSQKISSRVRVQNSAIEKPQLSPKRMYRRMRG